MGKLAQGSSIMKLLPGENKWQVLGSEVGKKDIDRIEIYDLLQDFEFKGI